MYCPKCGIENPDNGKFCRGCGANLINVLAIVNGEITIENVLSEGDDHSELYSSGVRNVILGMGFLLTSIFVKTMPGDTYYWLFFMIPAFCLTASGVSRILKSDSKKKERALRAKTFQRLPIQQNQPPASLPPTNTEYIAPMVNYTTDDLIVPSVTEETTKHLKIKKELSAPIKPT